MTRFSPAYSFALLALVALPLRPAPAAGHRRRPAGPAQAVGKDGGATGAFTYSTDPAQAAVQRVVKGTIDTYQKGLDSSDTAGILTLFAPDAVIEWENKPTAVGRAALEAPYRTLFQTSKFSTVFQYDAVDVYDNVALVRTHHLRGQTEQNLKTGAKTLDFNRELFILKKSGPAWKIIFYSFNTQPQQGVQ